VRAVRVFAAAAAAGLLSVGSAQAAFTLTSGGTAVPGAGLFSSQPGAITYDFDASLPSFFSFSGGRVVSGDESGITAAPPDDTTNYITVGPDSNNRPLTVTLAGLASYYGFYQGSPDTYNSLQIFRGDTLLETLSGTQLADPVPADGDQSTGFFLNIFANDAGSYFDKLVFDSTQQAFETDNHAVAPVPEPASFATLLAGLLTFGFIARRRMQS
jgi:hypothetical protein